MNKQLDAALLESQSTRIEADQANRNYNYMKRENQKLQQQTEDLSKQVSEKVRITFLFSRAEFKDLTHI